MKIITLLISLFFIFQNLSAQTDNELITKTLTDYIEGSTNGQPKRLASAFHPDLNLYYVKDDKVDTWSGEAYIADTKEGKPIGESGKILSIDYENNAAVAKVEISHPKSTAAYIDYFMLLKTAEKWTIVHKMFTKKTSTNTNETNSAGVDSKLPLQTKINDYVQFLFVEQALQGLENGKSEVEKTD